MNHPLILHQLGKKAFKLAFVAKLALPKTLLLMYMIIIYIVNNDNNNIILIID